MLYGVECRAMLRREEAKIMWLRCQMLRWMSEVTRNNRIINEEIKSKLRIAAIKKKKKGISFEMV